MFGYSISLNRVHDSIVIREENESIRLRVDSEPRAIVTKIRNANDLLTEAKKPEATEEDRKKASIAFAEAIFGKKQTEELLGFYNGDYTCVMTICGLYFEKRLCHKITKAQKKIK